jgi:para-aminobenzoate synthetase component 1
MFRQLAAGSPYATLLGGSPEVGPLNQYALLGLHPKHVYTVCGETLTVDGAASLIQSGDALFETLRKSFEQASSWSHTELPFHGGWMGYVGYGFSRWCEPALAKRPPKALSVSDTEPFPDLLMCEFEDWLMVSLNAGTLEILTQSAKRAHDYQEAWRHCCKAAQEGLAEMTAEALPSPETTRFTPSLEKDAFVAAVEKIQAHIRQGDVYQANLSFRLQAEMRLDSGEVFDALCRRNPSPFCGVFQWPGGQILSNSPERLVQVDAAGRVQTRPIAGTRGRGATPEEDQEIGARLLRDEKERAEHLMLVDLQRNDLGRVCRAGTVAVDELLALERYSHVTHLVSNVCGELSPGKDAFDVLKALFPGGTITGCPKIRCMQILEGLEPVPRGGYTGSLGYLDRQTGAMDFNILIRTLFLSPVSAEASPPAGGCPTGSPFVYNTAIHVGAGIVADSVGDHEHRECLRKAAAILGVLQAHESNTATV